MLQRHGVVLKGRCQVSHGRVSRVTRLSKKTEVGKVVFFYEIPANAERRDAVLGREISVDKQHDEQRKPDRHAAQKQV